MANAAATPVATKELRMQEALREALRSEMARDPRVFVMAKMWRCLAGHTVSPAV